jgi:NAD(P)-dependent dehydrogenase (short-subunit alcohol dehydrogenase family)
MTASALQKSEQSDPERKIDGDRMFTGKVIIVTGGSGNVGSALAALLASRGARIAAVGTKRDRLQAVTASLPGTGHLALSDFDLTDPAATTALVAEVRRTCGRLDGVGTTVGGFAMAKLAGAGLEQWDAMFSLNVRTTWNIYRTAVPVIREAGGGSPEKRDREARQRNETNSGAGLRSTHGTFRDNRLARHRRDARDAAFALTTMRRSGLSLDPVEPSWLSLWVIPRCL